LQIYNLITLIIVLTAVFGYINFRFIKLPGTIGIMLISLLVSLLVIVIGWVHPHFFIKITNLISTIDFNTALMKVMLGFLLFTGAIHIDIKKLKTEGAAIITFSTIGVLISTFLPPSRTHPTNLSTKFYQPLQSFYRQNFLGLNN